MASLLSGKHRIQATSTENMPKPFSKWLKQRFRGRRTVSPSSSAAQSIGMLRLARHHGPSRSSHFLADVQSQQEYGSKASPIIAIEPYAPLSPSAADPQAARPSTEAAIAGCHQPAAASQSSSPELPVKPQNKLTATEFTEQQSPTIPTSERLWNAAYDSLELEDAELVGSYVIILKKVLGGETGDPSTADARAELEDPTTRQKHMRKLVQNGQEKISKASRITTGVGDVANFVLSAKEMVDLVLKSVPQAAPAALPWAGVCLGLQVSNHSSLVF